MTYSTKFLTGAKSLIKAKYLILTAAALIAAAISVVSPTAAAPRRAPESSRKARHLYTAGTVEQAQGNEAAAYEYFKRAYLTDPTMPEAAYAYGSRRLSIPIDTLQGEVETSRSVAMMRQYVDRYPGDLDEAQMYAYVTGQLGNEKEAVRVLERLYTHHPDNEAILAQLSETYAHAHELPNALGALDRYERLRGVSPQVTMRKLSYLLAAADTAGAMRETDRLVASDPRNASYRVVKGNLFDIINRPDSAFAYYKLAESLDPQSGMPKLALAGYYQSRGDSTAYDDMMAQVVVAEDMDFDHKRDIVANYLQEIIRQGKDRARGDYLFCVLENQYPHEPELLDLDARYSAAKGDFGRAVDKIRYAIDLDPDNQQYRGQLMLYLNSDDQPDAALASYDQAAARFDPDNTLRFYYASIAGSAGRYDDAVRMYGEMIGKISPGLRTDTVVSLTDLDPRITVEALDMLSSLYASIGDLRHEAGDAPGAYQAYDNALTLNSDNSMAANNYAYFMSLDGGDLDHALQLSGMSLRGKDAGNPTFLDTYAWILYLKGDTGHAEEVQRKAIEALTEEERDASAEFNEHFGAILAANGKWTEATQAWTKAATAYEAEETKEGTAKAAELRRQIREAEPAARREQAEREQEQKNSSSPQPTDIINEND